MKHKEFFAVETGRTTKVLKIVVDNPQEALIEAQRFFETAAVHVKNRNMWLVEPFATITKKD